MPLGVLIGVAGCVAITAIYFLWVRKLTPKAPEQQPVRSPDNPA